VEQGSRQDLGRSIAVHRGTFSAGGWSWYLGGMLLLASVVGPIRAVIAPTPDQVRMGIEQVLAMAGIAMVVGVLVLILPVLRWRQQVDLYEGGFVWTSLTGVKVVTREQVRGVQLTRHRSRMGTRTVVLVTLADGRKLSITGVEQAEQFANIVGNFGRPLPVAAAPAPAWTAPGAGGGWRPPGT
jgi:hypothetical protein